MPYTKYYNHFKMMNLRLLKWHYFREVQLAVSRGGTDN